MFPSALPFSELRAIQHTSAWCFQFLVLTTCLYSKGGRRFFADIRRAGPGYRHAWERRVPGNHHERRGEGCSAAGRVGARLFPLQRFPGTLNLLTRKITPRLVMVPSIEVWFLVVFHPICPHTLRWRTLSGVSLHCHCLSSYDLYFVELPRSFSRLGCFPLQFSPLSLDCHGMVQ